MAVRKKSTKISRKVDSGISISDIKVSKKDQKTASAMVKNISGKAFLFALIFLILGVAIGAGAWWFVCKDDCFALIGQEEVVLTLEEKYSDEGVKIVAFGSNESENFEIETNMLQDEEGKFYSNDIGTYYIKYKSDCFKYGTLFKVEKVRIVTFVEPSEGGKQNGL